MEAFKTYITSVPAMTATAIVIIVVIFLFKFAKPIGKKIEKMRSVGKGGAKWDSESKATLPEKGLDKIREDYNKADEIILGLRSQNEEVIKIAQQLNAELENTKIMLFFERVARAMANWQYFVLKLGCEQPNRKITVKEALAKTSEAYPDLSQFITDDIVIATLDDLQTLNFVRAIRPYTPDTPIEFTEITVAFLAYINTGNLNI